MYSMINFHKFVTLNFLPLKLNKNDFPVIFLIKKIEKKKRNYIPLFVLISLLLIFQLFIFDTRIKQN